jgi:DNA-binding CsgD family transcriptional regulator
METMQQHFGQIEALGDIGAVLRYSSEVFAQHGVVRRSYHLTPRFDAPNSMRSAVYADGFDPDWVEQYRYGECRLNDPIPERTMRHGAMLTWQDARHAAPNSPANEEYFRAMEEAGLIHGFGLPLFGPRGRDGYAGIDFDVPLERVPKTHIGMVRALAQAAHQRVCVLLDHTEAPPDLSDREQQVLQWVARGKSVTSIATILDLSPDTVKTYTRRIYLKLGTSDRVGATVMALKHGLVTV